MNSHLRKLENESIYIFRQAYRSIKNISIESLRKNIRYIPQHPKLFNRTLYENIIYAVKTSVSQEEVLSLIKS